MADLPPAAVAIRAFLAACGVLVLVLVLYGTMDVSPVVSLLLVAPIVLAWRLFSGPRKPSVLVGALAGAALLAHVLHQSYLRLLYGPEWPPFVRAPQRPPAFLVWINVALVAYGLYALYVRLRPDRTAAESAPAREAPPR